MSLETKTTRATYEWVYAKTPADPEVELLLEKYKKMHPVIAKLLVSRGLLLEEEITSFFSTGLSRLKAAGTMHGMEVAAQRLIEAIRGGEYIRLYGDYDVDGTAAVAMMSKFLSTMDAQFDYYIPDRYEEGYGLGEKGVNAAIKDGVDLLITLDCGIRAVEPVDKLNSAGIQTIICDHHEPGNQLPSAYAILNPKQDVCTYLGKELCGCGVALMLILEIIDLAGVDINTDEFYELTAIATCSDIVPLVGVNRSIVSKGLSVISRTPGPGVAALLELSGFEPGEVKVSDVVFKIAPRINAAGRMDHARLGVELLTAASRDEALPRAKEIEGLNVKRKEMDRSISQEAARMMIESDPDRERFTTVVGKKGWHKGLIGIVASRLMEIYHRPTVVLTEIEGMYTGSARSVDGFDLHEALSQCSDLLDKFGGHSAAAGLTLAKENLEAFKERFESLAEEKLRGYSGKPKLNIALRVRFEEWHNERYMGFYNQLLRFRPFGPANLPPTFCTETCLAERVRIVGDDHLRFFVYQPGNANRLPAIAFNQADKFHALEGGTPFSMAYTIGENSWKGKRSLQLEVKDIRF